MSRIFFGLRLHPLQAARPRRDCEKALAPLEPSLITSVISTSRLYKRPWYQLIWGTAQVNFMLGSKLHKHGSALSVAHGMGVPDSRRYDTETKSNIPF